MEGFFCSIISCVLFYFLYGEAISKINILGVVLMTSGLFCVGIEAAIKDESEINDEIDTGNRSPLLNGSLALIIGFLAPIIIAIQMVIIRKYSVYYKGHEQGIDTNPARSLILTCFLPILM